MKGKIKKWLKPVLFTAGGAMVGYWATGNCRIASAPAIIRIMASTHANIGRRIKKFAMSDCLTSMQYLRGYR